ncbi:glutaredoxin domain-containing protein [Purpureocillium lavendulum]|uniref:Glutaredoxin domain-containing protein n=1 Tax=Purpureocillium lavendulum TaxID=1247861 RepID=A0AB34G2W0_9HYPO|nr:glutaredoxin domain-containing protein [Purpureocillium lavendulum]
MRPTMPSPRRLRLLLIASIVTVVIILFYSSGLDESKKDTRSFQDFYHKTMDGMSKKKDPPPPPGQAVLDSKTGARAGQIPADTDGDGDVDEDDRRVSAGTKERLRQAEQKAKDLANEKALKPDPPSEVVGKGNSADGQVKKPAAGGAVDKAKESSQKAADDLEIDSELNAILKKAPVIIFSKSYCPYSKRAKGILLEKLSITPAPYVVELDEHPEGRALQDRLKDKTGRGTVPNIMINGVSVGGSDEIVELDNADKLVARIRSLAGKRVEVAERFSTGGKQL